MAPHRSVKSLLVLALVLVGAHQAASQSSEVEEQGAPAEKCQYKEDETGNCLSPAYYQCQADWAKCSKPCKSDDETCRAACDDKYSADCGD